MNEYLQLWDAGSVDTKHWHRKQCAWVLDNGTRCPNPARRVQAAKYCEDHATSINYVTKSENGGGKVQRACARCGKNYQRRRWSTSKPARTAWNEFCSGCTDDSPLTLDALIRHNASAEQTRAWLQAGPNLRCEFPGCGRRLSSATASAKPRIDHNHRCCESGTSCGNCIRGVVCPQCNTKAAYLELLVNTGLLEDALAYLA